MHHGWTPVRVPRVGAKETEFDAAFLEECEKVFFINVHGSLRAEVHTRYVHHTSQCKDSFKDWQQTTLARKTWQLYVLAYGYSCILCARPKILIE